MSHADYGAHETDYGFQFEEGDVDFTEIEVAVFRGSERISERQKALCYMDEDGINLKDRLMFAEFTGKSGSGKIRLRFFYPKLTRYALWTMDVGIHSINYGEQIIVEPARKFPCSS